MPRCPVVALTLVLMCLTSVAAGEGATKYDTGALFYVAGGFFILSVAACWFHRRCWPAPTPSNCDTDSSSCGSNFDLDDSPTDTMRATVMTPMETNLSSMETPTLPPQSVV
ncbi:hypothetical protein H310_02407 [Aphanomyces invadans]|uniref:Uncharacterized protein n=1 Tax=Aphanomyces invadans TaxID=157072 RepID=A0A024UP08_9STRA|nr:hypothetical protein H310_02407 [Aphanomyces invadans]ETW08034.1 hypothetical protein H310_02407 [Aphanomyces invadans]|eukprot:XP_008864127.1 hypothetical protein H310_02407 [Aphanomyces invadans]